MEIKKLEGLDGNTFTLITNRIEITRNIDPGYKMLVGGQKQLLKGDKLESKTIYVITGMKPYKKIKKFFNKEGEKND